MSTLAFSAPSWRRFTPLLSGAVLATARLAAHAKYLSSLATRPNGKVCQSDRLSFDPKLGQSVG